MRHKEIKYVAVRPDGTICGPIGDNAGLVQEALIYGYVKATNTNMSTEEIWAGLIKKGYSIARAKIVLLGK